MATTYSVASSLDGFVAGPDDDLDWLLQFGSGSFQGHHDAFLREVGAVVMGATTYEWIRQHDDAWPYADRPAWVYTSREFDAPADAEVHFVQGDVATLHADVARSAMGLDVWVVGGGLLAAQYQQAGLLDELRVTVMPVAIGRGTPLLPVAAPTDVFRLAGTTTFDLGAVELHYTAV